MIQQGAGKENAKESHGMHALPRLSSSGLQAKGGSFAKDKDFFRFTLGRNEVILPSRRPC